MKEKVTAILLLIFLLSAVCINTLYLTSEIDKITNAVTLINIDKNKKSETKSEAERVFDQYKRAEIIISLTVSHEDLTNIEDCFVEMIAYLSIDDTDNASVAKSRLINSLEHLRRLSGLNIDSII